VTTMTTSVSVVEAVPRGQITLQEVTSRGRGRTALALLGPAFVASVAYVDAGNFATNPLPGPLAVRASDTSVNRTAPQSHR
jgi:hypothetical protein